ncbi:hypothetical protein DFR30_1438 [Thiogranum longum]|uniref:Glycosyltransferase 2-like domain-containing protein n=1 Tax=Thiogranum longum TaxID=1537524 RepID=A0A4R1HA22_9GAMM|nr:glycosyltransferase family 2 protein [Thiogranum longum]TCK18168.1 hypothetical protein DFR30_1438 [Thiogranum longum]
MNRVAIILVNWNGLQDTLDCLASLSEQSFKDWVAIVVDNNSRIDPSAIEDRYPDVVLLRNKDNLGFCGGNNTGISKAAELGVDYCWILNNDTEVAPDCLEKLVQSLDQDAGLGAVAHPINYYDDRKLHWFAGGYFKDGLPAHHGYFKPVAETRPLPADTEFFTGCSFLARTSLLQHLGGFDENYFCYVEDVDLSMRIKASGFRIGYVPDAVIWHKVSRSSGIRSPVKLYYKHRNMLYYLAKFGRPAQVRLRWWMISMRFILSLLLKHHDPVAAWALARGLIHGATNHMGRMSL